MSEERPVSKLFDFVEFKFSVDNIVRKGILLDVYLLNQEQWVKVLTNKEIENIFSQKQVFKQHSPDLIYKISDIQKNDYLSRFIWIITENSKFGKIRFLYNYKV